jgi:hypothetical protein
LMLQRMYVVWCDGWTKVAGHKAFHEPVESYAGVAGAARKLARKDGWRVPSAKNKDKRTMCPACWEHKLQTEHGVQDATIVQ